MKKTPHNEQNEHRINKKRTFDNISPHDAIKCITPQERRRFNIWIESDIDSPYIESYQEWIDSFYSECFPLAITQKHRETFRILIDNLVVSSMPISIFLDKSRYKWMKNKPLGFSASNVSPICNHLCKKRYVTLSRGYSHQGIYRESSTIQATEKLISSLPRDGLSFSSQLPFRIKREGLIVTKDFNPPPVHPPDVQAAEDVLLRYNQTVAPENMLYAVYKGSYEVDGRFHGSQVICLSKEQRRSLQIDREATFEADISNCLPALLYAQERACRCPGDAYDIQGLERELAKKAMLIMLNCTEKRKAIQALQSVVNLKYRGAYNVTDIFESLERKHKAISDYLYSGIGRRLMNIESKCMRSFLKEMLDKRITVYPIYDAVIGSVSWHETIKDSMSNAFTVNGISPIVH